MWAGAHVLDAKVERPCSVSLALVVLVDEQPPQVVRAEELGVARRDVVAQHHEADRGMTRRKPRGTRGWRRVLPPLLVATNARPATKFDCAAVTLQSHDRAEVRDADLTQVRRP